MKRVEKVFYIISFIVISLGFSLLPIYESRYYVSLFKPIHPGIIWSMVILIIVSSAGAIFYTTRDKYRNAVAILSILFSEIIILLWMPDLLGYVGNYGDELAKISQIRSMMMSGQIPDIIYPGVHLLAVSLTNVTNGEISGMLNIIILHSLVVFILYISIISRYHGIPLPLILIFVPFIITPQVTSASHTYFAFFLPVLHFLLRYGLGRSKRVLVVFSLLSAAIWVHHPLPALLAVAIILCYIFVISSMDSGSNDDLHQIKNMLVPFILFLIIGYLWSTFTIVFRRAVRKIPFLIGARTKVVTATTSKGDLTTLINEYGMSVFEVAWLVFKQYGPIVILSGIAGLGALALITKKDRKSYRQDWVFVIGVVLSGLISTVDFLVTLVPSVQFVRFLRPALFIGPITAAFLLYSITSALRETNTSALGHQVRTIAIVVFSVSIIFGTVISMGTLYSGPTTYQSNQNFVKSHVSGMEWFYSHRSLDIDVLTLWRTHKRWANLLLDSDEFEDHVNGSYPAKASEYRVPAHFGSDTSLYNTVGSAYLVSSSSDRQLLTTVRSESGRFTKSDFKKLQEDTTVNRIYDNRNIRIYKTNR